MFLGSELQVYRFNPTFSVFIYEVNIRQILFTLLISLLVITAEVSGQNPPINFPL
ncbi:MAG: hypothetical protein K9I69_02855 [Ignavibacteriales bacterium]|nr:hypothetical protein [Ignavibacteriales bacterium]MCF8305876.1 hypothetical protein [Ignavibacteriales bacterium]MCF8437209.1 hypothetical protein [Ignavibacteriales bacterium]